jgi:hypothetical protein
MRPTRPSILVALLIGAAAVSWGVLDIAERRGAVLPPPPWTAPLGIAFIAAAVLLSALALRRRMSGLPGTKPPHPLGVARMAVLGKACSHVGSLVGGVYGGYLLLLLPGLDIGGRRDRALVAGAALVAAVLLTVAGLLLERTCRVRPAGGEGPDSPSATA